MAFLICIRRFRDDISAVKYIIQLEYFKCHVYFNGSCTLCKQCKLSWQTSTHPIELLQRFLF